mmetsp:Transcript_1513/g.2177  ORF Transcript_1513/g.2177 Transcript_1513/m.2177 type:complete len:196 (+) Transcript_1513:37-624(+)|eukprot:CAMPEP_0184856442 /NCGR_PEP_ID=MMETSP0580-20130426/1640_1 /TAXON_ID=1118495 /ORGANISM="Dactyliosolen fragilissimus" /LENGTH=195 /DNA_ID=CAMNT_0027351491 /DNA_START=17 /DNA_END=604 /DNA_ORIENTATION=-
MKLLTGTLILTSIGFSNGFTFPGYNRCVSTNSKLLMTKDDFESNKCEKTTRREALSFLAATTIFGGTSSVQAAQPRAEYLTEPTDEFKESERQREEFRREQLKIKGKFSTVLVRLTVESNTEEALIKDLNELQNLVIQTQGLPLGIKKEEMIKVIRAKKAKGFWPTNVEYNYQALVREIAYQQSPNREKDTANPL